MPLEFGSFRREDRPGHPGPVLFWPPKPELGQPTLDRWRSAAAFRLNEIHDEQIGPRQL
jgi:hypothetical protein